MRAWRLLGGDWLAQGTSEHVLALRRGARIGASVHSNDVTVKASREDAEWLIQKPKSASPAPTPGVAAKGETRVEGSIDPEMAHGETTMFRAVAARLNFLSQDRSDIAFATMKLCSKMSRLDAQDLKNMKRVGRSFVGRPRDGCLFEWQTHPSALHAFAGADWAGDRQSRKSVSGHDLARKHLINVDVAAKRCGHQLSRRSVVWQHVSTELHAAHFRARRSAKYAACPDSP